MVTGTNNSLLGEQLKSIPELYREWLVGKGKSINTQNRYVTIYVDFLAHLDSRGRRTDTKEGIAKALTKDDIESFETKMGNKPVKNPKTGEIGIYDPNSMRQIRSGINKILVYYDRKELKLEVGPRDKKEQRCPTPEEAGRMLEATKSDPAEYLKLMFLVHTGRRQGVIRDLVNEDIDLETQHVTFRKNKGKKDQRVWIPKELVEAIKAYRKVRPTPKPEAAKYLFISSHGNHVNANDIGNVIGRAAVKAKIDWKIHPHSFRHFKNHQLKRGGADMEERRKFMGWESVAMVQEYSHEDQDEIDALAERTTFHPERPPIIVEEERPRRTEIDPTTLRKTLAEKLALGEINQETFRIAMTALGDPILERLR